jgi:molybdopterin synthase sulfur carrier subunit
MNITVRYFASMRDRMGRAEESLALDGESATVADIWAKVSGGNAIPDSTLIAVNMEYTDADAVVKDGDELAFFPPVTGG